MIQGGFFSMVVDSPAVLGFSEYKLVLDEGINVFNLVVGNLEEFRSNLEGQGVVFKQLNRLDDLPPAGEGVKVPVLPGPLV
jgi:hypothetical protein